MSSIVIAGDTSGSITLAAPAVSGSNTLTLPAATDTLVGRNTTDTLTNKSIAATQLTGTIAAARLPAGAVLQVVSTTVTSVVTTTVSNNSTFYAISGLAATITPTSTSNKIYAMVQLVGSAVTGYSYVCAFQLWRTTTPIGVGDSASGFRQASVGNMRASLDGNADFSIGWNYLDSPATTSATTYQVACTVEGGNFILNTTSSNSTGVYSSRSASSITLFEVAA